MDRRHAIAKVHRAVTRKLCYRKDDRTMRAMNLWRRYGYSKLSKMAAAAILNLFESKTAPLETAVTENPTLEQNMKWIGQPVAEISPLEIFPTWRWPPSWICSNRK